MADIWVSAPKSHIGQSLIRITLPTSQSYSGKPLAEIYQQHEKETKDKYNQRVTDIEKSSFDSLVFITSGGMAPETTKDWPKTRFFLSCS